MIALQFILSSKTIFHILIFRCLIGANENGMLFINSKHVGIDMSIDQLVRDVLDFVLRAVIKCFTNEV